jgi:hypothetical protein
MDETYLLVLDVLQYFFTLCFVVEAVLKHCAWGVRQYWSTLSHRMFCYAERCGVLCF